MTDSDVKTLAFYLPQFHPFPENDEWWGKGFTEWRNVVRARPIFEGHQQPREPADLGFCDLRVPEVREAQAALAREHGVHGFCYYYYWFSGRKVMNRPIEEVLASGAPDFPFCICWANENWSRLWDGGNAEILLEQSHTPETDLAFIHDVMPLLKDPRYIRIDGKPLLVVYRISLMSDPRATAETWRREAEAAGLPGLHLCAALSFDVADPTVHGFDSAVEFPPHGYRVADITRKMPVTEPEFRGKIYDYASAMSYSIARPAPTFPLFRTAMLGWDNSARKRLDALIYHGCTPELFEAWVAALAQRTTEEHPPGRRFMFVNAWNEWAEGTYLEPDMRWGRAFLEAHARAVRGDFDGSAARHGLAQLVEDLPDETRPRAERLLEAVGDKLARLQTELDLLRSKERWARLYNDRKNYAVAVPRGMEEMRPGVEWNSDAEGNLERIGGLPSGPKVPVSRERGLHAQGWVFSPTLLGTKIDGGRLLLLRDPSRGVTFTAMIASHVPRDDVARAFSKVDRKYTLNSGFDIAVDLRLVPPGVYEVALALHADGSGSVVKTACSVEVF